jgi:hypothetical protein
MIEIDEIILCKDSTLQTTLSDSKEGHIRVGTLVNHKNFFGVGIITHVKNLGTTPVQFKVHWIREGRDFGWSWIDDTVEILCK